MRFPSPRRSAPWTAALPLILGILLPGAKASDRVGVTPSGSWPEFERGSATGITVQGNVACVGASSVVVPGQPYVQQTVLILDV